MGMHGMLRRDLRLTSCSLPSCIYRLLNDSYVEKLGIHYMPNWKDPWGDRPMTLGEVGCFLSHYTIWKTVRKNKKRNRETREDKKK